MDRLDPRQARINRYQQHEQVLLLGFTKKRAKYLLKYLQIKSVDYLVFLQKIVRICRWCVTKEMERNLIRILIILNPLMTWIAVGD